MVFSVHLVTSTAETLRHHANRLCRIDRIPLAYLSLRARSPLRISDLRNKPLLPDQPGRMEPGQCCDTFVTRCGVCVPTYMRNTYPEVRSVLRAIIACRPEDSLRPVLSYPSSSLAIVPQQTHDHNPSFPSHLSLRLFLSVRPFNSLSVRLSRSLPLLRFVVLDLRLLSPLSLPSSRRIHLSDSPRLPGLFFSSLVKTLVFGI